MDWIFVPLLLGRKAKFGLGKEDGAARYVRPEEGIPLVKKEHIEIEWWSCDEVLGKDDAHYYENLAKRCYEHRLMRRDMGFGRWTGEKN